MLCTNIFCERLANWKCRDLCGCRPVRSSRPQKQAPSTPSVIVHFSPRLLHCTHPPMSALPTLARRRCPYTTSVVLSTRRMSSSPTARPYYFHVGASWAGKPDEQPRWPRRRARMSGFGPDTDIGRWTRKSLAQFTSAARERSPGEDFFYVQEVRLARHFLYHTFY